ncbi:MAG: hypothetical protein ACLSG8_03215 [Barnesiella sp.]
MKEDSDNLCYQIAFSRVKGMNILLARQWMETTGNLESFFTLPDKEIKEITGWNGKIISGENRKEALRIAKNELVFLEKKHVSALFFTQDNYPAPVGLHRRPASALLLRKRQYKCKKF